MLLQHRNRLSHAVWFVVYDKKPELEFQGGNLNTK